MNLELTRQLTWHKSYHDGIGFPLWIPILFTGIIFFTNSLDYFFKSKMHLVALLGMCLSMSLLAATLASGSTKHAHWEYTGVTSRLPQLYWGPHVALLGIFLSTIAFYTDGVRLITGAADQTSQHEDRYDDTLHKSLSVLAVEAAGGSCVGFGTWAIFWWVLPNFDARADLWDSMVWVGGYDLLSLTTILLVLTLVYTVRSGRKVKRVEA